MQMSDHSGSHETLQTISWRVPEPNVLIHAETPSCYAKWCRWRHPSASGCLLGPALPARRGWPSSVLGRSGSVFAMFCWAYGRNLGRLIRSGSVFAVFLWACGCVHGCALPEQKCGQAREIRVHLCNILVGLWLRAWVCIAEAEMRPGS